MRSVYPSIAALIAPSEFSAIEIPQPEFHHSRMSWSRTDGRHRVCGSMLLPEPLSPSNVEMGEGVSVEDPEHIQQPQNYHNDNNAIQNRVDARLHRNEAVHKPQQKSDDNQRNDNLNQGHATLFLWRLMLIGAARSPDQPCS
jgi:hypothetical protein